MTRSLFQYILERFRPSPEAMADAHEKRADHYRDAAWNAHYSGLMATAQKKGNSFSAERDPDFDDDVKHFEKKLHHHMDRSDAWRTKVSIKNKRNWFRPAPTVSQSDVKPRPEQTKDRWSRDLSNTPLVQHAAERQRAMAAHDSLKRKGIMEMKKRDEWDDVLEKSGHVRDEGLYKPGKNFHFGKHGFFFVGSKVKTPDVYKGVNSGTVTHAYREPHTGEYLYIVKHRLPADHPDAVDANGEPQRTKTVIHSGDMLTKHNPPSEEDDKKITEMKKIEYDELKGTRDNWAPYYVRKGHDDTGHQEYKVFQQSHKIATARLGSEKDHVMDIGVQPEHRRRGIATSLYNHIEKDLGKKLKPSPTYQTSDGQAFWKSRK